MPFLDSLGKLRDRVLAHSPENPMNVADLTAGLSSLIGRASKMPGSVMDKARLGRDMALGELGINKNLPLSEMPHEVLKALEVAAATGPKELLPTQRAARAARDMLGLSPEAMKARRELAREARAAEEASKQTRRNLALAGLGGLGLVGAAAAMNRRADDPDTYKHSSELGWQPRGLLRQKVAAPFELSQAQLNQAMADTRAYVPGQSPRMLSGYDMSLRAVPGQRNQVRMPSAAPSPAATPLPTAPRASVAPAAPQGVDPMGMFGSQAGQYTDRLARNMARGGVPKVLRLPEMRLGTNPFENVALPPAPALRLPEMQLGGGTVGPPRPAYAGLSDAQAIAAARHASQYGNFGGAQLAAGSRGGTRQFTADQARSFLGRNPNAASQAINTIRNNVELQPPSSFARTQNAFYNMIGSPNTTPPTRPSAATAQAIFNRHRGGA